MPRPRRSFGRADRLLRREDFRRVATEGRAVRVTGFVMLVAVAADTRANERSRLGITVSRRVGNATTRNRLKRRIREWFRHRKERIDPGLDIVVIVRHTAARAGQQRLEEVLDQATNRMGVLQRDYGTC